jgi:glucose/arabinose dehydrogenase
MQNLLKSPSPLDLATLPITSPSWFDPVHSFNSQAGAARIVFIDSEIDNVQTLASSVVEGTKVVLLNASQDGIDQISQVLAGYKNLESISIASHGSVGSLNLGSATLNLATLASYRDRFQAWSSSFAPNADILLYACNVAAGNNPFILQLSQLTGVDVAASIDDTGNLALGGNWTLESQTGTIESESPFDPNLLTAYTGLLGTGNGLQGEYYDNIDFTNLKVVRTDATVNYNWSLGSPDPSIAPDTFSVRWTGQVEPLFTDTYTFFTTTDDGVRLFVNGQQIINGFRNQSATEYRGSIALQAGQKYDIRMEYFDNTGFASAQLGWFSARQARQIIPKSQLYSNAVSGNTGTIVIGTNAVTVNENAGTATVRVDRINGSTGVATVRYTTANGSSSNPALAGQDYTTTAGLLTFADGETFKNVVIPILNDTAVEEPEEFGFGLSEPTGAGLGINRTALIQIIDDDASIPTRSGNGLQGEYYDNIDFTNLKVVRTDATVNYNWSLGSPDPSIAPDTFSVRWTGQVEPLFTDTYTFFTTTDDGVRLFVNGQQIINGFRNQSATEYRGSIALQAGQKYDIRMEYFDNTGFASAQLGWFSARQARQIIPKSQLYSNAVSGNTGTIVIGTNAVTVNENAGTATVRVDRINGSTGVATVRYTTANGSSSNPALAGQDYTTTAGLLTFADGETFKNVVIPILNDTAVEEPEEFGFGLSEPTGAGLGINRTALIQIIDDDATASYAFSNSNFNVDENGGRVTVTVQRSGSTTNAGSVSYATSNGTATSGADYTATSGTLNFAPGQTSQTFTVQILDDVAGERNETINLTLRNPSGGGLGTQLTATVTIADNDPGRFARDILFTGLIQPTTFEWTPGGEYLFIAQKNGVVRVARNGVLQQTPAIDISGIVNSPVDRGLIGMTIHPQFFNGSPFVYLLYSYDPPETREQTDPEARPDGTGNRTSRLGRFTATITNGIVSIDPDSEVVILGKNSTWQYINRPDVNSTNDFSIPESGRNPDGSFVQDFLTLDSDSHAIGTVRFGLDGFLYVSIGDGASYNAVDPRAVRTLNIDSLSGKIVRIDPMTGNAPASNPFYNGDPQSNRSKVWQYGLRNPFRFTVHPTTGQLYIGDVGWTKWEEVNAGAPGANFGWVAFEGNDKTGGYRDLPSLQSFYSNLPPNLTAPVYSFAHYTIDGRGGNAIGVGDFYTGNTFPSVYDNALFITDLSKGIVDALIFDENGAFVEQRRFAGERFGLTQMRVGADGNLYYTSLATGEFGRWRPIG